jgi:D-arginine dehydrogenase
MSDWTRRADVLVAGADPDVEDFAWLAGQGGYGIKTAPALARAIAAAVIDGVTDRTLSPARFR